MKRRLTIQLTMVAALAAWTGHTVDAPFLPDQAGTWEDDCNLSKSALVTRAAQPGSLKTTSWTRTAIGFQDRACRQVAAIAPSDWGQPLEQDG